MEKLSFEEELGWDWIVAVKNECEKNQERKTKLQVGYECFEQNRIESKAAVVVFVKKWLRYLEVKE